MKTKTLLVVFVVLAIASLEVGSNHPPARPKSKSRTSPMPKPPKKGPRFGHIDSFWEELFGGDYENGNFGDTLKSLLGGTGEWDNFDFPDGNFLHGMLGGKMSHKNMQKMIKKVFGKHAECQSNPCQNNGTCLQVGIRSCFCEPGFSGKYCELQETTQPGQCPTFRCKVYCPYGYKKNITTNCYGCRCLKDPCKDKICESHQVCQLERDECITPPCSSARAVCIDKPECPELGETCLSKCQFGLLKEGHCPACKCAPDPCDGITCDTDSVCKPRKISCHEDEPSCYNRDRNYTAECILLYKPGFCPFDYGVYDYNNDYYNWDDYADYYDDWYSNDGKYSSAVQRKLSPGHDRMGDSDACAVSCDTDADCWDISKCCYNGCGTSCVMPVSDPDTLCLMQREMMDHSEYRPECSSDGLFELVQCYGSDKSMCHCVDIYTGEPLRGAWKMATDSVTKASINCSDSEMIDNHVCPEPMCYMHCEYGFEEDDYGCNTCQCRPHPCEDVFCPYGQICQLINITCARPPCRKEALCLDPGWADYTCPHGDVLREGYTGLVTMCNLDGMHMADAPHEGLSGSGITCPSAYDCTLVDVVGLAVCCPRQVPPKQDKAGSCPAPDIQEIYGQRTGLCADKCQHDEDCADQMKCCIRICKKICLHPYVNANAGCQIALEEAILRLELNPTEPVFIPRCVVDGDWQKVQCLDSFGICWCVDEEGRKVEGTEIRGTPDCSRGALTSYAPPQNRTAPFQICPDGQSVQSCRFDLCDHGTQCEAHPSAVCRINPCGGCSVDYYNSQNNVVECTRKDADTCYDKFLRGTGALTTDLQFATYMDTAVSGILKDLSDVRSGKKGGTKSKRGVNGLNRAHMTKRDVLSRIFQKNSEMWCPNEHAIYEVLNTRDRCVEQCQQDTDCSSGMACCSTGCGHVCLIPTKIEERCSQPMESLSDCGWMEYGGLSTISGHQWFFNTKSQQCEHDPNSCDYSDSTFFDKSECEMACEEVPSLYGPLMAQCKYASVNNSRTTVHKSVQCHGGMCWCSRPNGEPTPGSLTKGPLQCDQHGNVIQGVSVQAMCPNTNQVPQICPASCLNARCHPKATEEVTLYGNKVLAMCHADPCDECKVSFYDALGGGGKLDCSDTPVCEQPREVGPCHDLKTRWYYDQEHGMCKPFSYGGCQGNANNFPTKKECVWQCGGQLCPPNSGATLCDDICRNDTCERFPEAICTQDPCTCTPTFLNPETGSRVQCSTPKTLCERARAEDVRARMLSATHSKSIHLTECDENGDFKPVQCNQVQMSCWCVNDKGEVIPGTQLPMDGQGNKPVPLCNKERTLQVNLKFKFPNDFSTVSDKKDEFTRALQRHLSDLLVVAPANIDIRVTPGSIVVHCVIHYDGRRDLQSAVDLVHAQIAIGKFVLEFDGVTFTADNRTLKLESIRDTDEHSRQPTVQLTTEGVMQAQKKEDTVVIVGAVCGVVGLGMLAGVFLLVFRFRQNLSGNQDSSMHVGFSNDLYDDSVRDTSGEVVSPADVPVTVNATTSQSQA